MNQFKDALYSRYVSTHFNRARSLTPDQYESYAHHYQRVYEPLLPANKKAHILEVGCGLGQFLYFLRKQGYENYLGIDIGEEQVELCRHYVTESVQRIVDTRLFLLSQPKAYDAIVFIDVFEHLDDDELLPILDAVSGALTESGKLIISVPNAACITALMTLYGDLTHRRLFTEGSIHQLLSSAGFENIQILPNEKKVIRSFRSRRERWIWTLREKFARWILSEFYQHLMEGSIPQVQTINLVAVAQKTNIV